MKQQRIKYLSHSLLPHLTLLFNQVLLTNTSPLSWKASNIVLIPKKSEDKSLIQNWRPIALLNSNCKIFMKIVANHLNKKILNTIIGNHQSGFCANRNGLIFCPVMSQPLEEFCRSCREHLLKSLFLVLHLERFLPLCQKINLHLMLLSKN